MNLVFALAFGIGFVAGLRSLTAPAAVAWAAHLGWLHLQGSKLAFMSSTVAVAIFSLLAIGELIADKLPMTPRRTALPPLLARLVSGSLCGACLAVSANQSLVMCGLAGAAGAIVAAFAGYQLRRRIVATLHSKDFPIAICEDAVAIALAIFLLSR
jgi:uncharacterized membrane protein